MPTRSQARHASAAVENASDSTPWLANPDWTEGIIADDSKRSSRFYWACASIFGVLMLPALLAFSTMPKGLIAWLEFAVLLGLVVGLFALAIYTTWQRQKFGAMELHLLTFPGAIGGQFAGNIVTGHAANLEHDLWLTLACIEREIIITGKSSHAVDSTLWQDDQLLTAKLPQRGDSTQIPVFFEIPAHCKATHDLTRHDRIFWQLTAHCPMAGVNFHAVFKVPVFDVPQPTALPDHAAAFRLTKPPEYTRVGYGIAVNKTGDDEFDVRFAPLRHPLLALQDVGLTCVFAAAPFVLARLGVSHAATITAAVCFGLIALFIAPSIGTLVCKSSRVSIRSGALALKRRFLIFPHTQHFDASEITSLRSEPSTTTLASDLYFLKLRTKKHRRIVIVDALSKHDADAIGAQMRALLMRRKSHAEAQRCGEELTADKRACGEQRRTG